MFATRLIAVTLSVFILAYGAFSLVVSIGWKFMARLWRPFAPGKSADVLFGFRIFPLTAAIAIAAVYVVPSYMILEPANVQEPVGPLLIVIAFAAFAWLLNATFRTMVAYRGTSRVLSQWLQGAKGAEAAAMAPVLRLPRHDPVLTVAGIFAPRVLLSETAASMLTREELEVALRHELAHIQHRDNLKKLLFRFASFPAMARLESTWVETSEMAADDAAVSSPSQALDLASALIKLSRFAPVQPSRAVISALLPVSDACLSARVARLFNWAHPENRKRTSCIVPSAAAIAIFAFLTYRPMLAAAHAITEWLVR